MLGDSIGTIFGPENRQKVFFECYRILKEKGILIVTLGNRYSSLIRALEHILAYVKYLFKDKIEFGDFIYDLYGKRGIHHNYSKREAIESLKRPGFKIKEIAKKSNKFIIVAEK